MDLIKQMADAFIILIRTGAVFRVVYCLVRMGINEDESAMYKKKGEKCCSILRYCGEHMAIEGDGFGVLWVNL